MPPREGRAYSRHQRHLGNWARLLRIVAALAVTYVQGQAKWLIDKGKTVARGSSTYGGSIGSGPDDRPVSRDLSQLRPVLEFALPYWRVAALAGIALLAAAAGTLGIGRVLQLLIDNFDSMADVNRTFLSCWVSSRSSRSARSAATSW